IVDLALKAYIPSLSQSLGMYVPLIVVNCIILGRAEAFASKEKVYRSALDGIGMSIGFILSICLIGIIRELFGTGSIVFFNQRIIDTGITNMPVVMILGPGAFLTLGLLLALFNYLNNKNGESGING
ncbi:MAG: electron transport complex subunit RsxE, partial [Candidatus Aenigmarchaeota archaeon]|nr:electron transport complex subunit RsxE [Candidatus Aenigmarchaeota archaeon]